MPPERTSIMIVFMMMYFLLLNQQTTYQGEEISRCTNFSDEDISNIDIFTLKKGVVDRMEGEVAVILIEKDNLEIILPKECTPYKGTVHSVLRIFRFNNSTLLISIDKESTDKRKIRMQQMVRKIRD